MYVQHESERVCVCVRGHACVCKWLVSVSVTVTQTRFLQAVQNCQAGGINTGSIPGSFASPSRLQDNLCLWVEKQKMAIWPKSRK